jgi:phosphatidylglycerol:prolipoprotein diacylglycerol transferase
MHHWFTYPTNVDPIAIHLGRFGIHWYGIAYLVGFVAVGLWMARPAGRKRLGLTAEQIQDFLFYALVGVLVGGRLFFVFNDIVSKHDLSYYATNPINIIAVWQGGMAFHGGLVGVIVAIALFLRKHRGLTFRVLSDEVVMMLPIGIALVRVVNFINDELWGDVCSPDHPWCMVPGNTAGWGFAPRHPVQFYEAIMDIATLPILLLLYKRKPKDGVVGWTWFFLYGITRSIAECFRQADFTFFGITGGQLYALPMIAIGAIAIWYCATRGKHTDETIAPGAPPPAATAE